MIYWLPLGAVILHLVEEFAWPGGFPDWYRRYRPERAASVTTSFLIWINALFVAMAVLAGVMGSRPRGIALWLVVASVAAANGAFHLWATVKGRAYSPGVVTGLLLYIPLAVFGFVTFGRQGLASPGTMIQAALVGPAYNVYAAWNHRRRALIKVAIILLPLLGLGACGHVIRPGPARDLPAFEAQLDRLRRDLHIPGFSAAIGSGGRVAWARGFGYADVEHAVPASDTTTYHLASLTKTFASTIVMQLVESGQLDLEAPVTDFGINLPGPGVIRVKHLLTHTSEGDPGSAYSYNGNRFGLLDQVILRASGETFPRRLTRLIIVPLHLTHTATELANPTFARNLAVGYSPDGTAPLAYPTSFGTAAGLMSSAPDVVTYSLAIDRNAFLRAETQARVFTPTLSTRGDTLPYGMGWFVQTVRGVRVQWHYGYWTANSSLIIRVPDRGLVFVLLANTDGLSRNTTLGAGDLLSSPAARLFLDTFVFGRVAL